MQSIASTNKQYDYGLAVLRMIMCFMVVLCHFWDEQTNNVNGVLKLFSFARDYAVPVFMIMSFYFTQKMLVSHEKSIVRYRFERLIIPQVAWSVIYWLVFGAEDLIFGTNRIHGISDLFWQLLTGHSPQLNAAMWYQVDLILITALFLIIIIIFKKKFIYALGFLGVFALLLQYTELNMIFSSLRFELSCPLGRIAEMIPLAVTGFFLASGNYMLVVKEHRLYSVIGAAVLAGLSVVFLLFADPLGYGYQGIKGILMGVAFITFFGAIPFEKLNASVLRSISILTKYTMGIYCIHRLIGTLMNGVIMHFNMSVITINSFVECIIIYLISYILCFAGYKVFRKTKIKMLFD